MPKYELAYFPQKLYRFELYDNTKRLKTLEEVLAANPGAIGAVNLWYFAMEDNKKAGVKKWDHQNGAVMLKGKWVYDKYDYPGICIDKDGYAKAGMKADASWAFAGAVQADYLKGKVYDNKPWPKNGVTYTGFQASGDMVILLSIKDQGLSGAEAVSILCEADCVNILRWDGSWSSRGKFPYIPAIKPSMNRPVRGWLIIYPRVSTPDQLPSPPRSYIVKPSAGLNIRSSPDGVKIGAYSQNAIVTVSETKNGWGKTNLGWVSMSHLKPQ